MTARGIIPIPTRAAGAARNHYCARCRKTQAFADLGETLHCPVCDYRLWRLSFAPDIPLPVARRSA